MDNNKSNDNKSNNNESNMKSYIIVEAARNQFASTYKMLTNLVEVCPKHTWYESKNGIPFWYQIYHVTYFIDYWFRDVYDDNEFRSMIFDERIKPEFEEQISNDVTIQKEEMMEYQKILEVKITRFFDSLDDEKMAKSIVSDVDNYTYTDVIIGQIRHIMYNIGYLNGHLREQNTPESDWYAYNEH